jgi:excisionase family DNA binding protein
MSHRRSIANKPATYSSVRFPASTPPRLILCVDDDIRSLEIRKLLLERAGYRVLTCRDGKQGITAFASRPVRLVVLDYSMPGLNGAEVARVMRETKPHVPILMLSGHSVPPDEIADIVDLYIPKGGDTRHLLDGVHRLLARQSHLPAQVGVQKWNQNAYERYFLNTWKEVAEYLGRGVRTVQRWEKELKLPVHRPRGKARSTVIATAAELDEWVKAAPLIHER